MTPLLEVRGLSRVFGGVKAVSDLDFHVDPSEILGLIGPNGAGKTTVVNLVSGMVSPTGGNVSLRGETVTNFRPNRLVRRGLTRTFQAATVYRSQTVYENGMRGAFLHTFPGLLSSFMQTGAAHRRRALAERQVWELLETFGLGHLADVVAEGLPYGHQKLLGIVVALASQPALIMLDEPVAGLGGEEVQLVREAILRMRERGIAIVVIDHNMRFIANLCDRVVVLQNGRELAQGAPNAVLRNPDVIEAYLGKKHAAIGS